MDPDEAEIFGGMIYQDEDSGSAYEESSPSNDDDPSRPENVSVKQQVTLNAKKAKARERSITRKSSGTRSSKSNHRSSSRKEGYQRSTDRHESVGPDNDNQIFEDAQEWAATFRPPAVEDIRTPSRHGSRKRRVHKPPSEIRYKRLQPYYDNDYRELLNAEIYDAAYGEPPPEALEQSQIGSSIWTAAEKNLAKIWHG
jgi:RNA polymerase I-specific transcription initiation factor RRN5